MHIFSSSTVTHLLGTFGYWAVLVLVFAESMGIPVPGETILIAAALYAGATHQLIIWWVVLAAIAGAILGDNTGYGIGRVGGFPLLRRFGRYIRLDEGKLKLGQYIFLRYGAPVVFFGRFVSVLRAYAAFLAGVNRMPWLRFLVFNAMGGILWACLYGFGAYFLGTRVKLLAGPVGIGIGVAAAIIILAFLIYLWRNMRRLQAEAERALPGPLTSDPRQLRQVRGRRTPGQRTRGQRVPSDQARRDEQEHTGRAAGRRPPGTAHPRPGDGHVRHGGERRPAESSRDESEREDARSG